MKDTVDLDHVATSIVAAFPTLDLLEQRLSFELYRLLAEGGPVPRETLAQRLTVPVTVVTRILERWPGVFYDSQRRIVGYWGLSISVAHASPHQLTVGGRKLSAWYAWDPTADSGKVPEALRSPPTRKGDDNQSDDHDR